MQGTSHQQASPIFHVQIMYFYQLFCFLCRLDVIKHNLPYDQIKAISVHASMGKSSFSIPCIFLRDKLIGYGFELAIHTFQSARRYHRVLLVACPRAKPPWPSPEFYQTPLAPARAHTTET
uniref:Uncharacterized protein n=1 Tax=Triticum urartu TaxID=4572 RepID=A0A8R7RAK1_TRIUA